MSHTGAPRTPVHRFHGTPTPKKPQFVAETRFLTDFLKDDFELTR
jgi:hypothetical protein